MKKFQSNILIFLDIDGTLLMPNQKTNTNKLPGLVETLFAAKTLII